MVLLCQHIQRKEKHLSELLKQRQLKGQCSDVLVEPHRGSVWSDLNPKLSVCIEITTFLHSFRIVRVSPEQILSIGQATSYLDALLMPVLFWMLIPGIYIKTLHILSHGCETQGSILHLIFWLRDQRNLGGHLSSKLRSGCFAIFLSRQHLPALSFSGVCCCGFICVEDKAKLGQFKVMLLYLNKTVFSLVIL